MRSMKTSGGLTRGRWMTEQQRLMWLLSMPACAEVNQAMQELTGVNYSTREQNKDMGKAIQARDWKDTLAVVQYLQERNPFSNDPSMRNIATGVHAPSTINVDTARSVGAAILKSMEGKTSDESRWRGKPVMNTASYGRTKLSLSAQSHLSRSTEWKSRLIHNSSSKDSSLLHRHQMNWSPCSIMNYAATHQLCSIPLSCSEQHTGQPLLMPSGFFLNLMFKQMSQLKTAVQSATWCNNVLVGDDTDILVLLCYHHPSFESHDLFFCPEPKENTQNSLAHGTSMLWSNGLGRTYASTSYFYMQSLGAIQHLASMALERDLPSKHQVHLTCIHRPYHQRQEQPIITGCVCTGMSKKGRDLRDCSTLRRTCKKHDIECTPACGNCRGSGCTNSLQMSCDDDGDDGVA